MEKLFFLKGNNYFDSKNIRYEFKNSYNKLVNKYIKTRFNKVSFKDEIFIPAFEAVFEGCISNTPKNIVIEGAYIFNYMLASENFVKDNVDSNLFVDAAAIGIDVDFIMNQFTTQNQLTQLDGYKMKNQHLDILTQKPEILTKENIMYKIPKDLK